MKSAFEEKYGYKAVDSVRFMAEAAAAAVKAQAAFERGMIRPGRLDVGGQVYRVNPLPCQRATFGGRVLVQ